MRIPAFCICKNKGADQLLSYRTGDQRLSFALHRYKSIYILNPKFQASSHLLSGLHSSVCVRSRPEVIKLFSCSTQVIMKFILLINVKMPTTVGILTFISRINDWLL